MNLRHIYNDHINTDMPFDKLKQLCSKACDLHYGFLVIDKDRDKEKGRYRLGFDTFVQRF